MNHRLDDFFQDLEGFEVLCLILITLPVFPLDILWVVFVRGEEGILDDVDNARMMCPAGKLDTDLSRVSEFTGDDTAFMIVSACATSGLS